MSINLEQVDILRQRTNVSYEDAKEALEKCNYDLVEALVYLEKTKKMNSHQKPCGETSFTNTIKHLVKKGNETKFIIKKNENVVINIPLNVALISTVIFPPITIAGIAAALLTNHNIKLGKSNGENVDVNQAFCKMSTMVTTTTNEFLDKI